MAIGWLDPGKFAQGGGPQLGSPDKPSGTILAAGYIRKEPAVDKTTGEVRSYGNKAAKPSLALRLLIHADGHEKAEYVDIGFGNGSIDKAVPDAAKPGDFSDLDEAGQKAMEGACDSAVQVAENVTIHGATAAGVFFDSLFKTGVADVDQLNKIDESAATLVGCRFNFTRVPIQGMTPKPGEQPPTMLAVLSLEEAGPNWGDAAPAKPSTKVAPAAKAPAAKPAAVPAKAPAKAPAPAPKAAPAPAAAAAAESDLTSDVELATIIQGLIPAEGITQIKLSTGLVKACKEASRDTAFIKDIMKQGATYFKDMAEAGWWAYENGTLTPAA